MDIEREEVTVEDMMITMKDMTMVIVEDMVVEVVEVGDAEEEEMVVDVEESDINYII